MPRRKSRINVERLVQLTKRTNQRKGLQNVFFPWLRRKVFSGRRYLDSRIMKINLWLERLPYLVETGRIARSDWKKVKLDKAVKEVKGLLNYQIKTGGQKALLRL